MCSRTKTIARIKASKIQPKVLCEGADVSTKWLRELVNEVKDNQTPRQLRKVNVYLDQYIAKQVALQE